MWKPLSLFVSVIIVLSGVQLMTLRSGQAWGDDFALYVAHARNIAEGRPYDDTGYIYNPKNAVVAPRSYPPIFPLLLAPVYRFYGLNLPAMKVFVGLLFAALLGVLALVFRKSLPFSFALVCLVLFAVNPYVWQNKDRLLSETPFMLFAYLALLLAEKAREADESKWGGVAWGFAAGLVAYLAFGTRTVGILLVPCILGAELIQRRRLRWASLAMLSAFVFGVAAQKYLLPSGGSGSYLDQLVFDPLRFARIGVSLILALGAYVGNGYSRMGAAVLYGCLCLLAGAGFAARLRKGATAYEFFFVSNFLIMTLWPAAESNQRFILPLLPLFLLYIGEGLCLLGQKFPRSAQVFASVAALAILISNAGLYSRMDYGPVRDGASDADAVALFDWIRGHTAAQDAFLFQKPKTIALYAQRAAMAPHKPADDEQMWQLLRSQGITHVILCPSSRTVFQSSRKILQPFLERHADEFEMVYVNSEFRVYRRRDTNAVAF